MKYIFPIYRREVR